MKRLTGIVENGQYAIEQTYVLPKINIIECAVAGLFGRGVNTKPFITNEEKVKLKWLKPDSTGHLK